MGLDVITGRAKISGDTILLGGSLAVNVSGQPVYLISGNNAVQISGQSVSIIGAIPSNVSGNIVYLINDAINNVVKISGQSISILGSIPSNISGNVVYLISGQNSVQISGQTISIAGTVPVSTSISVSGNLVIAKISGESVSILGTVPVSFSVISISGNAVKISGETVTITNTSFVSNISGQIIYFVSGKNDVQISGQSVSIIGTVPVSIAATLPVTTSISGNMVYFVSGNNAVQISGQTITFSNTSIISKISGESVSIIGTVPVSFATISVSGNTIYLISGKNDVQISGQSVSILGTVPVSIAASVLAKVSGETVRLVNDGVNNIVQISGQTIQGTFSANISGNVIYQTSGKNDVQISGQTITFSNTSIISNVSGQSVRLPNDGVNNVVQISGQTIQGTFSANISGNIVYFANDGLNNVVKTSGQTLIAKVSGEVSRLSDGTGNLLATTAIGSQNALVAMISGQPVTATVTTNVSGNIIYQTSGKNDVQISGQTITFTNTSIISNISGQRVNLTTDSVANISGQRVNFTTDSIANISGQVVSISGAVVNTSGQATVISGQTIIAQISGQIAYTVSGQNSTFLAETPTYQTYTEVVLASGSHAFVFYAVNTGSIKAVLSELYVSPVEWNQAISGSIIKMDVNLATGGNYTSGTAVSAIVMDPLDNASGAAITIKAGPVIQTSGVTLTRFNSVVMTNMPIVLVSGTFAEQNISQRLVALTNLLPFQTTHKPLMLNSGRGITVQQSVDAGYPQVVSGKVGIRLVYSLE